MRCESRLEADDSPYREGFAGRCWLDVGHAGDHELVEDKVSVRWADDPRRVTCVGQVAVFSRRRWV